MVTVREQFSNFDSKNPVIATTYNFDYRVIRDLICPRRGIHERSIIFTDADCFKETALGQDFFNQGLSYFVYPAHNVTMAFHPKVAIGVDDGVLKLLVGSHNLTEGGIKYNLEITGFYEIPISKEYEAIVSNVSDFLNGLSKCVVGDQIAIKSLNEVMHCLSEIPESDMKWKKQGSFYFLHSFKKSIIEQVLEIMPEIKATTICVPTHSDDPTFLAEMCDNLGDLHFYIDPNNRFTVSDKNKNLYRKFSITGLEIEASRSLHGKVYIFHTSQGDWTLFGSPNFTKPALAKSVGQGGNLEAAILLEPFKEWKAQTLFEEKAKRISLTWDQLSSEKDMEEEEDKKRAIIEQWGFQTPSNEAVIFSPGVSNGEVVFVRLSGISKPIEVVVTGGMIRFKVPDAWDNESRYEVLDKKMQVLVKGFLNRTGAAMNELSNLEISDESKIRLWFFINRLKNFEPHKYDSIESPIPLILLDPKLWIDGPKPSPWLPVSSKLASQNPDQIFNLAQSNFETAWDKLFDDSIKTPLESKLRLLMVALDIYIESVFYASVVSKQPNSFIAQLGYKLAEFFDLPCFDQSNALWDGAVWKSHYFKEAGKLEIEEWKRTGSKMRPDVNLLFDFWIYFFSSNVGGYQAFDRRPLDVPINVNRLYQVFQALKILISPVKEGVSFRKVWDDRMIFLESEGMQRPADYQSMIQSLENCNYCLQKRFSKK